MEDGVFRGQVPIDFKEGLSGRDTTPLSPDMWLKFQYISYAPTRATNFHYILFKDGRLFFAINSENETNLIFDTPLPEQPTRILSPVEISEVKKKIKEADFFNLDPYLEISARGGALIIVSIRRDSRIHEVWFSNVDIPLTDFLFYLPSTPQPL